MAVIRCSACGKPNPDFLDACQYCDAALPASPAQSSDAEQTLAAGKSRIVRCPACGKPNPSFLDACQFCETPLRPSTAGDAPTSVLGLEGEPEPSELTDPLARLRASAQPAEPESPRLEAGEDARERDWMSRLRGLDAAAKPEEAGASAEPDWLWTGAAADYASESRPSEAGHEAEPPPGGQAPDWRQAQSGADRP